MKVPEIWFYVKAEFSEWTKSQQHADAMLGADEFGNKYVFVFTNQFTKYTIILPGKDKTSVASALAMLHHVWVDMYAFQRTT